MLRPTTRIEQYLKRRERSARRRCGGRRVPPRCSPPARADEETSPVCRAVLDFFSSRLRGYPGVVGLLYRPEGDTITVRIVAPAPMTEPIRLLSRGWSGQLQETAPRVSVRVCVSGLPPRAMAQYSCVFWREL